MIILSPHGNCSIDQTTGVGISTGPGGVESVSALGPGEPLFMLAMGKAGDVPVTEDVDDVEEEYLTRSAISLRQMGQRSSWMAHTSQKPLKNGLFISIYVGERGTGL